MTFREELTAADTVQVNIFVSNDGSTQMDVNGNANAAIMESWFAGKFVTA